jgi:hypothetical protein
MRAKVTHFYMKINNGNTPIPLPDLVRNGQPITARWANSIRNSLERLRDRVPIITGDGKIANLDNPPLWVTLFQTPGEVGVWKIYVQYGQVVPRHNTSTDLGTPIEITALPTQAAPLTVVINTKLWVKLTISDAGKCTAAAFESGTSFPDDTPPQLKGGDNTSGTTGYRHIRIAEIIADPNSSGTPPLLITKQLLTGHIDHFQNELVDNIDTTGSNILKKFDIASGVFQLRTLTAGAGITITENADSVEVAADGASGGWWGTVSWLFVPGGGGGSSQNLVLTFEAGILTEVTLDAVDIPGTEATPGDAELEVNF